MSEDKKPSKPFPNKPAFDPSLLKGKTGFKPAKGFGKPLARKTGRGR
jgi:hypothetical protein